MITAYFQLHHERREMGSDTVNNSRPWYAWQFVNIAIATITHSLHHFQITVGAFHYEWELFYGYNYIYSTNATVLFRQQSSCSNTWMRPTGLDWVDGRDWVPKSCLRPEPWWRHPSTTSPGRLRHRRGPMSSVPRSCCRLRTVGSESLLKQSDEIALVKM